MPMTRRPAMNSHWYRYDTAIKALEEAEGLRDKKLRKRGVDLDHLVILRMPADEKGWELRVADEKRRDPLATVLSCGDPDLEDWYAAVYEVEAAMVAWQEADPIQFAAALACIDRWKRHIADSRTAGPQEYGEALKRWQEEMIVILDPATYPAKRPSVLKLQTIAGIQAKCSELRRLLARDNGPDLAALSEAPDTLRTMWMAMRRIAGAGKVPNEPAMRRFTFRQHITGELDSVDGCTDDALKAIEIVLEWCDSRQKVTSTGSSRKRPVRTRDKNAKREVLVGILCKWHGYQDDGSVVRLEPICFSEVAKMTKMNKDDKGWSKPTASRHFSELFGRGGGTGYQRYVAICTSKRIGIRLAEFRDESRSYDVRGSMERDEDRADSIDRGYGDE